MARNEFTVYLIEHLHEFNIFRENLMKVKCPSGLTDEQKDFIKRYAKEEDKLADMLLKKTIESATKGE